MKICVTTTIYTHTGGLIRLCIVIWSVLSQFKWLLLFLHHAWRGHGARLSIRTKDPNNHSDTETGTLSMMFLPGIGGHLKVSHMDPRVSFGNESTNLSVQKSFLPFYIKSSHPTTITSRSSILEVFQGHSKVQT